ncbi:MAG: cbb3-type cytochrome oxidase assembly protein CcoS [Paracoccaceae bacterium]
MSCLLLILVAIAVGLTGLGAFFWSMRHNQYVDLDGAVARILTPPDQPLSTHTPLRKSHEQPDAG